MSIVRKRKFWMAGLLVAAGTLFQFLPGGCRDYAFTQAVTAFNFCSIVNCNGGTFFDMCYPVKLLADCPERGQTTDEQ